MHQKTETNNVVDVIIEPQNPLAQRTISEQLNILKVEAKDLVTEDDLNFLLENAKDFQDSFAKRSYFRSEFEFRYGVLNDDEHPTPDSKYWQAIGERSVHVEELISLSFTSRKLITEMEKLQAEIEEIEYLLNNNKVDNEFERRKLQAKLKRKKIELEEKEFHLTLQRKTAKERMREIRNSTKVINELRPQLKYGDKDFEQHHAERYFERYKRRVQRLELLSPENKENVISHFLSFCKAPENRQLVEKFIEDNKNNQLGAAVSLLTDVKPELKSDNTLPPPDANEINFSSKEEMMENDPVTKKFFSQKTRKIMIAVPHRYKDEGSCTNFYLLQTPAAFDVFLEQPYGFSVPDARNFCVKKAIDDGIDYIFFVDDDLIIPRNSLVHLLHYFDNKDVAMAGGFYYRKYFPLESASMHIDNEGVVSRVKDFKIGDVLHNVIVLTSGCTLIRTELFKRMEAPWYRIYLVNNRPTITEDSYICQRTRDIQGGDIILDTGVQCIHVDRQKGILYGHPDIVDVPMNTIKPNWRDYFAI